MTEKEDERKKGKRVISFLFNSNPSQRQWQSITKLCESCVWVSQVWTSLRCRHLILPQLSPPPTLISSYFLFLSLLSHHCTLFLCVCHLSLSPSALFRSNNNNKEEEDGEGRGKVGFPLQPLSPHNSLRKYPTYYYIMIKWRRERRGIDLYKMMMMQWVASWRAGGSFLLKRVKCVTSHYQSIKNWRAAGGRKKSRQNKLWCNCQLRRRGGNQSWPDPFPFGLSLSWGVLDWMIDH